MPAGEAAAAAAAGAVAGGAAIGVLPEGTTPPEQQQMPGQGVQPPGLGALPALLPTIDQLMAFLVQQQMQMAEMMKTFSADKASGREHLANARLDERNFRRIKVFTNKREDCRDGKFISLPHSGNVMHHSPTTSGVSRRTRALI